MSQLLILSLYTIFMAQVFPTSTKPITFKEKLYLNNFKVENNNSNNPNDCFVLYLPQLQAAANQWSANYADCYNNASNRRNNFIEQLKSDHVNINESSTEVSNYIKKCQNMTNDLDYFKCFGDLSQNVISIIYIISNNATDDALLLSEQLEGVDLELYSCTNDTQRVYVEKTAIIFDALDNCLTNGLDDSNESTVEIDENRIIGSDIDDDEDDDTSNISGDDMAGTGDDNISTLSGDGTTIIAVDSATTTSGDITTRSGDITTRSGDTTNVSVDDTITVSSENTSSLSDDEKKTTSVDDITTSNENTMAESSDDTTTLSGDNTSTFNSDDTSTFDSDDTTTLSTVDTSPLTSSNVTSTTEHTTIPIMSV